MTADRRNPHAMSRLIAPERLRGTPVRVPSGSSMRAADRRGNQVITGRDTTKIT
jgi:hypothetical protein